MVAEKACVIESLVDMSEATELNRVVNLYLPKKLFSSYNILTTSKFS